MLKTLRIRNLATIEEAELEFDKGFSILTGETGAGKSMIIGSIRFVTGEKSREDIIRTGESEAVVEAVFDHPSPAPRSTSEELLLRRRIGRRSQGKAYLNGDMVPMQKLKGVGGTLVDIYGQNDHVFLQRLESQRDFLDVFADIGPLKEKVVSLARELRRLAREKRELTDRRMEREQKLDFLNFQIGEIESAELDPSEEEKIRKERELLKNSENIRAWVEEALALSYERDEAVLPLLDRLRRSVSGLSVFDPGLVSTLEEIDQFSISLREFTDRLIRLKETQDNAGDRLEKLEARLSRIETLKRKYGKDVSSILDYLSEARIEHEDLLASRDRLAELEQNLSAIFTEFQVAAKKLGENRRAAAGKLETAVENQIAQLGMKKARFQIRIQSDEPDIEKLDQLSDSGLDHVEFDISPNPGEDPKPLRKTASGGELSRLMLALKSVAVEHEKSQTLIFDEIDSGIGGKTADFVARELSRLSLSNQVLCITHLPQIASRAHHHFKISKQVKDGRTYTSVNRLGPEERVLEIARLLVGTHVTETAMRNAREMLDRFHGETGDVLSSESPSKRAPGSRS